MGKPAPPVAPVPVTVPDAAAIVDRARKGDTTALPALRVLLQDPAAVDRLGGDLARQAELALVHAAAGQNLALREALTRKLDLLRAELAGPAPAPLERLLVSRVVACWLQLHHADMVLHQQNFTLAQAEHHERKRDRAHKRYLSAIKTLALVRKLALPFLQVNVVNNATALPPRSC
jgi:hypothetical protein